MSNEGEDRGGQDSAAHAGRALTKGDASVETGDARSRERGWVYRGDRVTERRRVPRARRPQVSRYSATQQRLAQDLFNRNWHWVDTSRVTPSSRPFTTVDLFSGCGGLSLGFDHAGLRPLLGVEIDVDAAATYAANFQTATVHNGLIEDLTADDLIRMTGQSVDVLCAGFPCQGFSVAGSRDPGDRRNKLFREVVRAAEALRPAFVVLENVPGVITMSEGRVFESIRASFAAIGYDGMSTLVLEAADYGVPQYRPRAIFIANRFGLSNPFPKPRLLPGQHVSIEAALGDLISSERDAIPNHDWTYHSPEMERRISAVEPGGSLYDSYTDAWKRQYRGVPAMTVKENHGGTHIHYELDRTLSARELARLQSFPDSFVFKGRMKRVMFQVGNAVPVLLAENVALALIPSLERANDEQSDRPER
jgi:DNA (cytosine-5)-methyltransferase 1